MNGVQVYTFRLQDPAPHTFIIVVMDCWNFMMACAGTSVAISRFLSLPPEDTALTRHWKSSSGYVLFVLRGLLLLLFIVIQTDPFSLVRSNIFPSSVRKRFSSSCTIINPWVACKGKYQDSRQEMPKAKAVIHTFTTLASLHQPRPAIGNRAENGCPPAGSGLLLL